MKTLGLGFSAILIFAASCYSPDLSGVRYSCDEANPYCPDGLECIGGSCLTPGSTPTVPDGGTVPDGMVAAPGCKSGSGFVVGSAYACPGAFDHTADQLCASGYRICTDSPGIDQTACKMLSGFFAAAVNVRRTSGGSNPSYGCGTNTQDPYLAGCGRSMPNIAALSGNSVCMGFTQALACVAERNWDCNNASLSQTVNRNAGDGVLCCKIP